MNGGTYLDLSNGYVGHGHGEYLFCRKYSNILRSAKENGTRVIGQAHSDAEVNRGNFEWVIRADAQGYYR